MSSTQSFRFMDLPGETRANIFHYLLPNLPVIDCDTDWTPNGEGPPRHCDPYKHETDNWISNYNYQKFSDEDPYTAQILRVNRQIYAEAFAYLYTRKTFVITVYRYGFDFLKHAGQLEILPNITYDEKTLPEIPYNAMKEFVIRIDPNDIRQAGQQLRRNLIRLCGLLAEKGVHFKKLRMACMSEPVAWSEFWCSCSPLWQYPDHAPEIIPPEISDDEWNHRNFDHEAWEYGYSSSLAYLLGPLQMLSNIADEAVIEFPVSCAGIQRFDELKDFYEQLLGGRYPFCAHPDDDGILEQVRWEYKHPKAPQGREIADGAAGKSRFGKLGAVADAGGLLADEVAADEERVYGGSGTGVG
ncbi:MAG: hypothetical protein Q9169_006581 [Polycauliona sp. 2 TL-2023]